MEAAEPVTVTLNSPAAGLDSPQGRSPQRGRGTRRRGRPSRSLLAAIICLTPAVAFVTLVLLVPFAQTVHVSTQSDGLHPTFVGFDNYVRMFQDPILQKSLINTFMWVVGSLLLPVAIGLAVAVMANGLRWGRFARLAMVLPYALSGTAVAVVGSFLLRTDGAVNQALGAIGLQSLQQDWLLDWPLNTISTICVAAWQATGVSVVLFMVGLQGIPPETVEAAAIDGAGGWRRFRHVILPQLRPVTMVVVGVTLANALRAFDVVWVLTNGGPARTSETLGLSMYRATFLLQQPALGAALAVLLTLIVVASSWIYLRNESGAVR